MYLGLSYSFPGNTDPMQDAVSNQAYVTVLQYPETRRNGSTGAQAIALDGAQTARHVHPDTP